jgi:tetratricopeptide (TPR) repeat protein
LQYATKPPELAAGDADALARRGAAALAAGEPARALDDLNRAISLAPATAPYLFDRARVHLAMRQPRPALADLDEALRLDPALADARARRSRLRAELGDRAGAEADLAQLDASLPPTSHLRLGMAHLHAGFTQLEPALKQFDLWIAARPDDAGLPAALSSRCWLRTRLNVDLPQALKDCQRAVSIDGGDPALHGTLGWALLRTGDADRARKAFDRAIALRPQATPLTLYGRGLALTRLGDTEAAQRDLAAARAARQQVDEDARKLGLDTAPPP